MPIFKKYGKITNDRLCTDLKIYGYVPVRHTHVLCKYEIRDIIFTLIVDEFGIKFTSRKDEEHLLSAL